MDFTTFATVNGNYQSINRLKFDAVEADAVRIHITTTNGIDEARLFEVGCYA